MAKADTEGAVTLSVLDRLIDLEPGQHSEAPLTRAQSLRRLKAAVKRDLEWLLNSRRTVQEAPPGATELERSVYHYGLPDFTGLSLRSTRDQQRMLKMLETTIAQFEPRLSNVRVRMEPLTESA
ncbi:MAG: type VI secretion system baseplate subunit TssE, partial [Bryobacteraceae bacterium]